MPSILFNNIPGSGLVAPIFAFEVNSAGGYGSQSRLLLVGHKVTAGSAVIGVPVVVGSQNDADALFGAGSMLREMFRIARQNAPVQEIWALPVTETGVAQTWTVTIGAGAAGTAGTAVIDIHGERINLSVSASDTITTIAAAVAAAINAYYNALTGAMLPFTATSAVGVVTLTARHMGAIFAGEDPTYLPGKADGIVGNLFTSTTVTVASATAGTGVPTLTTPFAALGDDQYDLMVSPWADTASLAAYNALLNDTSGRWSYARQSYGHMITVNSGSLSSQTTLGLTLNDRHTTVLSRLAGGPTGTPHPPWLWAAGIAARVMPWLGDYTTGNVSRNQTGLVVQGLGAPRDRTAWWQYASRNTLVSSGISTWSVDAVGNVIIDKLVTTYRLGNSGQPDIVFRDLQAMLQLTHILRFIRTSLANQHGQKAIADYNPGNLGALCTVKDIKGTIIAAHDQLARQGLVEASDVFAANLTVQRNGTAPNRVDVFLPLARVKPLDVLAANATLYAGSLPTAA